MKTTPSSRRAARQSAALALAATVFTSLPATADWVNLTGAETAPNIAEITVHEDAVEIALEVYPADESAFFRADGFGLEVRAEGVGLEPQVRLRETRQRKDRFSPFAGMIDPRTRRRINAPPEDPEVIYLELVYALEDRPATLTFVPPLEAHGGPAVTIGFLLYHRTAPVVDFRYLSQPEVLHLDWGDPWYTAFENRNLTRHHRWPQTTLLYVEPREVRHESLVRVRDLMTWTADTPDLKRVLDGPARRELLETAGEFFEPRNPVSIDGTPVRRTSVRAAFLELTPQGLRVLEPDRPVDASSAVLGVSESYGVESLPGTVTVEWQLFDERVDQVSTLTVDPAGPYPGFIDAESPVLEWKNFIREWTDPVVQPVAAQPETWLSLSTWRRAWGEAPEESEAASVLEALLRQLAIAYLERDPVAFETALTPLIEAAALDDLRPELDRIFAIPTTGGGVASIAALGTPRIEEISPTERGDGFSALARWQAESVGRHWGHVDRRRIGFRALLDLSDASGSWKLRGLTVLEARALDG